MSRRGVNAGWAKKFECLFRRNELLFQTVNPAIQAAWTDSGRPGYYPFSAAQKVWREEHCATINPYGSDGCPFDKAECTYAYAREARSSITQDPANFVGLFRTAAKRSGLDRAENKPRMRTHGHADGTPGVRDHPRAGSLDDLEETPHQLLRRVADEAERGLRRAAPRSVGSMFGEIDLRPRPSTQRRNEGQESTHDTGDPGVDLRVPSPMVEMGDVPPTRTEGVHPSSE